MAYTVLARKYRPQTLSELVGQDTLVKVLTNSFKLNRIAHSFLLTGSRGIGKETPMILRELELIFLSIINFLNVFQETAAASESPLITD